MVNIEKGIFLNTSASSLHTFVVLFFQLLILTKEIFYNDCYTLENRRAYYSNVGNTDTNNNNKIRTICGMHTTNMFGQRNYGDKYNSMNLQHENYWNKSTIYWTLNVTDNELVEQRVKVLRREINRAFKVWSDAVTYYTFVETVAPYTHSLDYNGHYEYKKPYIRDEYGVYRETDIDIFIGVYNYSHGDPYPFDGPGQVLGHAFFPDKYSALGGDIHIDGSDYYDGSNYIDLFHVLLHEIGHSLGLSHNTNVTSVMYNFFSTDAVDYYNPILPEIDMLSVYKLLKHNTIDKYKYRFGKDANGTYGYFNETTTTTTTTTPATTKRQTTASYGDGEGDYGGGATERRNNDKFFYKEKEDGAFSIKRRSCNWPPYFNPNPILENMEIKDYNLYNTINRSCIRKCNCYSWVSFAVSVDNSLLLIFTNTNGEFYISGLSENGTDNVAGPYMLKDWENTKDVVKSGYGDNDKIYLFTVNRYMFVYNRTNFDFIEKRVIDYNIDCLLEIDSKMYMSSNNSYYSFKNAQSLRWNERLSNIKNVDNDIILNEYLDLDSVVNWNKKIYGVKNSIYWELELFPNTLSKFRKVNIRHLFNCPINVVVHRRRNNKKYDRLDNFIPNVYSLNKNVTTTTRNRCSTNDVYLNYNTLVVLFLIYYLLYVDYFV